MQKAVYLCGKVVKGFGRGSKTLGTPTANFDQTVVETLPAELKTGIYFGWAQVDSGPIYGMVGCIGWNPYFQNKSKSVETHVLHNFQEDFYGSNLRICLTGYIRDEKDFKSIDELKEAINHDIEEAKQALQKPEYKLYAENEFFTKSSRSPVENGSSI